MNKPLANGKPQPGSAATALPITSHLYERLEYFLAHFFGHSDTGVQNLERQPHPFVRKTLATYRHGDRAFIGELDAIAYRV